MKRRRRMKSESEKYKEFVCAGEAARDFSERKKREKKTKTNLSRVDGICRHFLLAHRMEKYSNRLNS